MRTGKQHLIQLVVLAGFVLVPAAQASSGTPYNPTFQKAQAAAPAPAGISPDDRPYARGLSLTSKNDSVSPDDRAFSRAIPVSSKTIIVSPDDRAFARSTPAQPRALPASVSVQPGGFDWGDALIGGTFGLVLALLGAGAVAIALHHRRDVLRTA